MNKTIYVSSENETYFLIDAAKISLGRLATVSSLYLRNKINEEYQPNVKPKNIVIIINSDKIQITGNKNIQKMYYKHSGRPGGLRKYTFKQLLEKDSRKIVEKAIKGMLPKTSFGRECFRNLKVYKDSNYSVSNEKKLVKIINF